MCGLSTRVSRGAYSCVNLPAVHASVHRRSRRRRPDRPRDELVQLRGHRAAGGAAARAGRASRTPVAGCSEMLHRCSCAEEVVLLGAFRCADRRAARCRAVAQGADRGMRGQGDTACTVRPYPPRKNVGRRPQFLVRRSKGGSRPALRSGRFRSLPSEPRLPVREFPRGRRAGCWLGFDASVPHG